MKPLEEVVAPLMRDQRGPGDRWRPVRMYASRATNMTAATESSSMVVSRSQQADPPGLAADLGGDQARLVGDEPRRNLAQALHLGVEVVEGQERGAPGHLDAPADCLGSEIRITAEAQGRGPVTYGTVRTVSSDVTRWPQVELVALLLFRDAFRVGAFP